MARVTVEDCVLVVPNRFELCLIASNRAKSILSGSHSDLERSGEKPSVISLREIGDNLVDVEAIRDNIVSTIRNRGRLPDDLASNDADISEQVVDEINNQPSSEANFVSENIEVDD